MKNDRILDKIFEAFFVFLMLQKYSTVFGIQILACKNISRHTET